MSKGDEGLSLVGNGNRVATTSAAKSDPKIIEGGGGGTKRTEPMEPQVELYLSSDDEGDEHAVEMKRNKTTRLNSLMRMRRWVEMQQSHFAQNATAPPISTGISRTSSHIVHKFGKLINSLDEVIDALGDRKRRGDPTYDNEGAQRPIKVWKAAATTVQKVSPEVQPKEKSVHVNSSVESGKNHECSVCKRNFTEKRSLISHLFVHLSREEQAEVKQGWRHVCYFCTKRFDRPSHLARHLLMHTTEKVGGRCHLCRKAFVHKRGLTRHRFTHLSQDEKVTLGSSRVCLFCHKIFRNNPTYHAHLVTHIPEKPFRCDQCGKQFPRNNSLVRHKRSHSSNPKPFSCDECDQAFTQEHHLKSHKMTVHRKLKDFACPQCTKKFSKKSDMETHLNGVHFKVRHPCSHCGKIFGWKTTLWTHLKQVHPSECRPPNN